MSRILHYTAAADDDGKNAGTLFRLRMGLTKNQLARLKFHQGLLLDGEAVHTDHPVRKNQTLTAVFDDSQPAWSGLRDCPAPLSVVFEDEDLLIVDKSAPLPSIASGKKQGDTLEGRVWHYFGLPENFIYRLVNRLDKGTSGIMVIAKNALAQSRLQKQLHTSAIVRIYLAVTEGIPAEKEGCISFPIRKESAASVRRVIAEDGRPAVTHYRILHASGTRALLRLQLETGRTHQIRVHLAAIGCPVAGDYLYGQESPLLPGRFALHSCCVEIIHPVTGEPLRFTAPLPPELKQLLPEAPDGIAESLSRNTGP